MARVITAPQILDFTYPTVFLAGAIDMGEAVNWQDWVIDRLSDYYKLIIFNPRRERFTPDTLDEQILWELKALRAADCILLWFPKDSKAPVSMLEAGLFMGHAKMLLGADLGFYRRRNLELTAAEHGRLVYTSLDEMVNTVREMPFIKERQVS